MGEKKFKHNAHRKPKFQIMRFSTDPTSAFHLANENQPDDIDDIDGLFDELKYQTSGAANTVQEKL